jgi:hypothetical protein
VKERQMRGDFLEERELELSHASAESFRHTIMEPAPRTLSSVLGRSVCLG